MAMTPAEKELNRFARMLQKFRELTIQSCKKRTAQVFQKLVRLKAMDENGRVQCVSCETAGDFRNFDSGHFIPRRHNATLFDFRNCHPQCRNCNHHLSGNLAAYRVFMETEYGLGTVCELELLQFSEKQFTREELVGLRIEFMDEVKHLTRNE